MLKYELNEDLYIVPAPAGAYRFRGEQSDQRRYASPRPVSPYAVQEETSLGDCRHTLILVT